MKAINYKISAVLIIFLLIIVSCLDLEELNINPNGVDPAEAQPFLLMSTVLTYTGQNVVSLGFGDLAGVMQHTQKDGWSGGHNAYDWSDQNWGGYYGILRNTEEMLKKTEASGLEFYQAVALIMKAYNYGMIADLWGDAPFSEALQGETGNLKPAYDSQKDIYIGILGYLETANTLLSKSQDQYSDINPVQDVLFRGSVMKWRKFTNSLALRYYMRISSKESSLAKTGIEKIVGNPSQYPIIRESSDDANIDYVGNSTSDSWPCNTTFDVSETNWRRLKMCSTLVEKLQELDDPRLALWANKITTPLVIDQAKPDDYDEIVDGKRIIAQNVADTYVSTYGVEIDPDPEYVGLPPSWSILPQAYNLCPNLEQAPINPHASHINNMYKSPSGPHLKARLISAAEVNFILAEAALKGWSAGGTVKDLYEAGVKSSMDAWGLTGSYSDYIEGEGVAFEGTLSQIIEQKWIASWTSAAEAWFDYRRTGYPALAPGKIVKRNAIPLRFYYGTNELLYNPEKAEAAIQGLETTSFSSSDGKNSPWSKSWLLQGTGKPW
ncbi:MAG TPA: SusD/RagB family nutrient-binding outer membrane lipoprotein [Bacteroidales bacterium]|nr:SusD/RagB family nutrient-binding outer membrane lipoprotein [Bacteroidales bacterium]HOX73190.1 SusD/RagB family nutrient-binding outer membrane lipoprotein [Bacteroidales bacterium]HPM87099.1 SusD/RagB family nutrient-binding outer membrane lipoprotein [Bacteroidales bacterium]